MKPNPSFSWLGLPPGGNRRDILQIESGQNHSQIHPAAERESTVGLPIERDNRRCLHKQTNRESTRQKAFLRRLAEAIRGLDETTLCNESVMNDWTLKDIRGHIVSWNEECRVNIEMIIRSEYPNYNYAISSENNFSTWNRQGIIDKRKFSLDQILAE